MSAVSVDPILVCGVGSVGERHIANARALGCREILVYRQRRLPPRTLDFELPSYDRLADALAERPRIAIISNPTALHLDTALACAEAGCHLFIEKPLSHTPDGADALANLVAARDLRCMVAYMGRFHPAIRQVRAWIEADEIGDIVHYRALWGDYLPDWHPWEDYRDGYAARTDLGGGPTHTLSHELDLLYSFLGMPQRTLALRNDRSALEVQTEHGMDMLFAFANGATANLHVDFFQKPPHRELEICGTRGKLAIDYQRGQARLFRHDRDSATVFEVPAGFERNDQFVAELAYFFECVEHGREPQPSLADGSNVVTMADEVLRQAGERKHV